MKNLQAAVKAGAITWTLIFLSFTLMESIPALKGATTIQNSIVLLLIIPFTLMASNFYYKRASHSKQNGIVLGALIMLTCLSLDAVITLPLVIIPKGGSYLSFFTDPGLAIMGSLILATTYLYWKLKIQPILG